MKSRCYNKNSVSYKYYGDKGVSICGEWLNSFSAFYNWAISNGYSDNLTIDRINPFGNYEPNNCRWATYKEQNNNQRKHYKKQLTAVQGKSQSHKVKTNTNRSWSSLYNAL